MRHVLLRSLRFARDEVEVTETPYGRPPARIPIDPFM